LPSRSKPRVQPKKWQLKSYSQQLRVAYLRPCPRSRSPRSPRPPPPPPGRSALGRASFTLIVRPPTSFPFSPAMAFSPSSAFAISTNANPRDLPVSRSVRMLTRSTCPKLSKSCRNSSSAVLKLRLPTKIFFNLPLSPRTGAATTANRTLLYQGSQTRGEYSKSWDFGQVEAVIARRWLPTITQRSCPHTSTVDVITKFRRASFGIVPFAPPGRTKCRFRLLPAAGVVLRTAKLASQLPTT